MSECISDTVRIDFTEAEMAKSENTRKDLNGRMREIIEKMRLDAHRFANGLLALLGVLREQEKRLPIPRGIFVGQTERQGAYAVAGRLLGAVEELTRQLCTDAATLTDTVSQFSKLRTVYEAERLDAGVAEAWQKAQNCDNLLAFYDYVMRFCTALLPSFIDRVSEYADMEHEGEACNPNALLRLVGEFRLSLEQLQGGTYGEIFTCP